MYGSIPVSVPDTFYVIRKENNVFIFQLFFFLTLVKCVVSQTAMSPSQASVHLSSEFEGEGHASDVLRINRSIKIHVYYNG